MLADLLTFENSECYMVGLDPSLAGVPFGEVQSRLYNAVAIGFERKKEVFVNPDRKIFMQKDDQLLVLSGSGTSYRVGEPREIQLVDKEGEKFESKDLRTAETLCILGSNEKSLSFVLSEFDEYMLKGSRILILPSDAKACSVPGGLENIEVEILPGSSTDPASLKRIPLNKVDSIIIMSTDSLSFTDSDAQTITSTLLLRQLTEEMAKPPPIICEILDVESRELLDQRSLGVNFVLSSEITSVTILSTTIFSLTFPFL